MPSASLRKWMSERIVSLDEIENAHVMVGGSERGRRYATQQINQAYVMLLSSQYQGFCRDLHTECAFALTDAIPSASLRAVMRAEFVRDRKLDRGNPNPGNIGADFNRFGLLFWAAVGTQDQRNRQRQAALVLLNDWRNAIAHQDFDPGRLGGVTVIRLDQVRRWRSVCHNLADSFDEVMRGYIQTINGTSPW